MAPDKSARTLIAKDTIERSPKIVFEHKQHGASVDSIFVRQQLPPLEPSVCPNPEHTPVPVDIINSDAFTVARNMMANDPAAKVAVLNLASDILPAGPWLQTMTTTQEEALCYSSTLYVTLKKEYYPWPNLGEGCIAGVYSPGVVIFRADLDHDCVELPVEERRLVSVVTVAAPARAALTTDGQAFKDPSTLNYLREKIRLVCRMAAHNGNQYLILGAMGCGAYGCPPRVVATEMRDILVEAEFRGWFKKVAFAIYSRPGNGPGNFQIFEEIFKDVQV
ncbi:hypothetical protein B0H16DRAFT_1666717 [Mycena metata]|uniref:Microbial-type PARG catalytic domain-containing protein n=1 Tax=Mycena metata TaxID=1033252 RepID=A0AAD7HD23_9AGAR|nr:hypothetical protein B0H16DRAFT_1666717 [Mycena metata]